MPVEGSTVSISQIEAVLKDIMFPNDDLIRQAFQAYRKQVSLDLSVDEYRKEDIGYSDFLYTELERKQVDGKMVLTHLGSVLVDLITHGNDSTFTIAADTFTRFLLTLESYFRQNQLIVNKKLDAGSHRVLVTMEYLSSQYTMAYIVLGALRRISSVFQLKPTIYMMKSDNPNYIGFELKVEEENEDSDEGVITESFCDRLSNMVTDCMIESAVFCVVFPWHFILNQHLDIVQMGISMEKACSKQQAIGNFNSMFRIIVPANFEASFEAFTLRVNSVFIFELTHSGESSVGGSLRVKGQMVELSASETILFLGSPEVTAIQELKDKNLFISDVPVYDARRDVVLVGQQTKVQDGLRKRMDTVMNITKKASDDLEKEQKKNIEILNLIFPADIARRLWLGESIEATSHEDVTILLSDIVGFTAYCQRATPLEVIQLLENMYNSFDTICGELDVYKVETIGDAYCAVSGLQNKTEHHAHCMAWMALLMTQVSCTLVGKDNQQIKLRIGIHTGTVLAGVVGVKMPRYCLLGYDMTIVNKMEASSQPLRTLLSPTTHRRIKRFPGFEFELYTGTKPMENLPGDLYFLNGYKHPRLGRNQPLRSHVRQALVDLKLAR